MTFRAARLAICCAVCVTSVALISAPVFEKDVRPILKAHCFHCHGEDGEKKAGLDVRLARFLLKGGESGPAIVAGKPAESHLLDLLKRGEMPKEKAKLPEKDIATIEAWILAGHPRPVPNPKPSGRSTSSPRRSVLVVAAADPASRGPREKGSPRAKSD